MSDTIPAFTLPIAGRKGESLGLPFGAGKGLTLLAFYKNSCPTCRFTFPLLQRMHEQVAPAGGRVIGISQDGEEAAVAYAAELGLTFPILVDGADWPVSRRFGIRTVPSIYLIDGKGAVVKSGVGFARDELQAMAADLAASVSAPAAPLYKPAEEYPAFKAG